LGRFGQGAISAAAEFLHLDGAELVSWLHVPERFPHHFAGRGVTSGLRLGLNKLLRFACRCGLRWRLLFRVAG
jgi:hypothetical protein